MKQQGVMDDDGFGSDKGQESATKLVGNLKGLDAQSQYIITHQRDIITDLKHERSRLQIKVDELTRENRDMEKKIDRMELEQTFETNSKSGLNGISQNPIVQEIARHAAPALGEWLMKVVKDTQGPDQQLTGGENADPEVQKQIMEISTWYGQQPKEIQAAVYEVLNGFAESDPAQLANILKRITLLMKNGTSINKQYTGTWN